MRFDIINPYVLKILIAARKKDSINSISARISLSYGWTYKWIKELEKIGVFRLTRMEMYLNPKNAFYKMTLKYIQSVLGKDVQFYYEILSLFGISYSFTKTDSVFVWTNGGYNISRYKGFYPIFIKVKKTDRQTFGEYCKKIDLKINQKAGVFYKVEYLDDLKASECKGVPVDSLGKTIEFMQRNKYNFEPALEMIKEMYKQKIKVSYKEAVTNV